MKKFLILTILLIFSSVFFVFCSTKKDKKTEHEEFAKLYVECFIKDNPITQFDLLDISKIKPDEKTEINYKRSPLVAKNYSVSITNTREASDVVLKKINNVYANYCKNYRISEIFKIEKAYRYNIKIKNKGKQIYNVSFWVVQNQNELSICTVYEYERSLDRGFMAGLY